MSEDPNNISAYLYGMILLTTSHRLAGKFPTPDSYSEIVESHRLPGGETGTCAIVLANLGVNVILDGNHLGRDTYPELSKYFDSTSVSLELATFDPEFAGLEDLVFSDSSSRTCFGRFCQFYAEDSPKRWNQPGEEAIRHSDVAGIDPFFYEESIDAARLCFQHQTKFVTIDCRADSDIHRMAAVNILSAEFLRENYPGREHSELFSEYVGQTNGLVIFTFGDKPLWFGRKGHEVQRFTPYQVAVQSTLGAGDSFKAGAIFALGNGMDDAMLVRFASATAAAACMSYPIAKHPPDLARICDIAGESFGLSRPI